MSWLESPHVDYALSRCVTLAGQGVIALQSTNLAEVCTGDAGAGWSASRSRCLGRWMVRAHIFEQACVMVPVPRNGHWALAVIWHPCAPPRLN